jgi:hypothetical protein
VLKLIGTIFRTVSFAATVLVLGSYLRWGDHTVSDQIRLTLSHAERSPVIAPVVHSLGEWTRLLSHDVTKLFKKKLNLGSHTSHETDEPEEVSLSERQKLRALIIELNRSHR